MARIKGGLNAKKRHNRTLKLAKGYRGARSKQYRVAKQSVMRALTSSYAGRKQRRSCKSCFSLILIENFNTQENPACFFIPKNTMPGNLTVHQ